MIRYCIYMIILVCISNYSLTQYNNVITFSEYLAYVKKYHPIVKQANLILSEAEAKLLKARGAFDPKLEFDYNRKRFKKTQYYNQLNAAFKIPVWYGIQVKGGYEQNSGIFLNPEERVPNNGLYNLGVSISLAKGLLFDERMNAIKQAKLYQKQAEVDNQIIVNEILYNAISTYFNWVRAYKEQQVHQQFLQVSKERFLGVKKSYFSGDKPVIDTIEARVLLYNQKLNLEKSKLNYIKKTFELSNFLWIDDVPIELQENVLPELNLTHSIDETLKINDIEFNLLNHPKLQSLNYKFKGLEIEKKLRQNNLLPKINLEYNFLTEFPKTTDKLNIGNYKAGISVSFPLFLRKERAMLKLTSYKLQAINYEQKSIEYKLKNKIESLRTEIKSYKKQMQFINTIVIDNAQLLAGEERRFEIGESSLFIVNSRQSKLIKNKLKQIEIENLLLKIKAKMFNLLSLNL